MPIGQNHVHQTQRLDKGSDETFMFVWYEDLRLPQRVIAVHFVRGENMGGSVFPDREAGRRRYLDLIAMGFTVGLRRKRLDIPDTIV